MIRKLDITNESTGASKPKADVELTIGVDEINEDGELSPGNNTISARFKKESEGYQTIHLIRMENDTDLEKVENWVNWYREGGLQVPAPVEFIGGASVHC